MGYCNLPKVRKKVKVKVAQSCPTLCDSMDYTVHRILQARILEWVAFPFSRGSSELKSPSLQVDSLPAEPQGKPISCVVIIKSHFHYFLGAGNTSWKPCGGHCPVTVSSSEELALICQPYE